MGDRYFIQVRCECGYIEDDVYYAPTCGFNTFKCNYCGKTNLIISTTKNIEAEKVTGELLFNNFMAETNVGWDDVDSKSILKECKEKAKIIRNSNKGSEK